MGTNRVAPPPPPGFEIVEAGAQAPPPPPGFDVVESANVPEVGETGIGGAAVGAAKKIGERALGLTNLIPAVWAARKLVPGFAENLDTAGQGLQAHGPTEETAAKATGYGLTAADIAAGGAAGLPAASRAVLTPARAVIAGAPSAVKEAAIGMGSEYLTRKLSGIPYIGGLAALLTRIAMARRKAAGLGQAAEAAAEPAAVPEAPAAPVPAPAAVPAVTPAVAPEVAAAVKQAGGGELATMLAENPQFAAAAEEAAIPAFETADPARLGPFRVPEQLGPDVWRVPPVPKGWPLPGQKVSTARLNPEQLAEYKASMTPVEIVGAEGASPQTRTLIDLARKSGAEPGERVWFLMEEGQQPQAITSGQAAAFKRAGKTTTWVEAPR